MSNIIVTLILIIAVFAGPVQAGSAGCCLSPRLGIGEKAFQFSLGQRLSNPYGSEEAISRNFDDLDEGVFQGAIGNEISRRLTEVSELPLRVLLVGGGRYTDLQLRMRYLREIIQGRLEVFSYARENLVPLEWQDEIRQSMVVGDANDGLPFHDKSFDVIIIADVVYPYFKDKLKVLSDIQRVLRSGGRGFAADFGFLSSVDINQRYRSVEVPRLRLISRLVYPDGNVLLAVSFSKEDRFAPRKLLYSVPVFIGDAIKFESVYEARKKDREVMPSFRVDQVRALYALDSSI